jgi:uncharacterized membrane protein
MKLGIFIFGGAVLIASGVLQALVRPRKPNETPSQRLVNSATVRAAFFCVIGLLLILVGAGVVPLLPMGPR